MPLKNKTVLVFTGGGLAPALNPTLYGIITAAQKNKMRILGGLYGWACLAENGYVVDLTRFDAQPLRTVGGTILRSSRTNPLADGSAIVVLKNQLRKRKVDYVVAIGGDDTLGTANQLFHREGIQIVGVPKTIDNDLQATYWTPGYPSAAFYAARFAYEIKVDAAYALSRIFIVEVIGFKSGWIAAATAHGLADVIVPPEKKVKLDKLLTVLLERYNKNGSYATLVVSEQAQFDEDIKGIEQKQKDTYNVKRTSFVSLGLAKKITEKLGIECKALIPGNYIQTGPPRIIDAQYAVQLGEKAIELIKEGKLGHMAALERPSMRSLNVAVTAVPLERAVGRQRTLDDSYFDFDNFVPTKKFTQYTEPFLTQKGIADSRYLKLIHLIQQRARK